MVKISQISPISQIGLIGIAKVVFFIWIMQENDKKSPRKAIFGVECKV